MFAEIGLHLPVGNGVENSCSAIIGELSGSISTILLLMPVVYSIGHRDKPIQSASQDLFDEHCAFFQKEAL